MSPRRCSASSHERGRTWAWLAGVYLLVLAGCATGVSGGVGGHRLPGPSPSAEGAALEAPSTPDEDDDLEDDSDEEARALEEGASAPEFEGEESLALAVTGEAKQRAGEVRVAEDGTLRAGRYEVGPFYAIEAGRLWPVDEALEVVRGAGPLGPYAPDDGVLLPALEGAGLALVDTVEGLYRLVFHTGETLEGLTRLPGAVRQLVHDAPEYWEAFRHKPYGERLRTVSRLTTHVVLMVGSGGQGRARERRRRAGWASSPFRSSH